MKRTAAITIAIAGLLLASCGSDSDSEGGASETQVEAADVGGAQGEAAQAVIDDAAEQGLTLDEECVNDVAAQLSDEDAELIAKGADEEVSAEGDALSVAFFGCFDDDALVDLLLEALAGSGQVFDEDCVREKLEEFDVADIVAASQGAEPPADVVAALVACAGGG